MARTIERYIRIENANGAAAHWRTLPNGEKVGVWDYGTLTAPNEAGISEKRFIFRVNFIDGVRKGSRVTYLGNHFCVLAVSDSQGLTGLELTCAAWSA